MNMGFWWSRSQRIARIETNKDKEFHLFNSSNSLTLFSIRNAEVSGTEIV